VVEQFKPFVDGATRLDALRRSAHHQEDKMVQHAIWIQSCQGERGDAIRIGADSV
jgi:hypothetical protein